MLCHRAAEGGAVADASLRSLDACSLVGRGLLVCAVDARGALDSDARLQTPVATEPLLAPLCKGLRDNHAVIECAKSLRTHLPRRAAASYQFVPTELWKGGLEKDMVGLRVPRQSLKARNAIVKLVWFIFPPGQDRQQGPAGERTIRVAVLEMLLVRPGATLPRHFAAELRPEDKAAMWEQLNRKHLNPGLCMAVIFGAMGLDSEALQEEPAFHALQHAFLQHLLLWFNREESKKTVLMEAWCPNADVVIKEAEEFTDYLFTFFDDNHAAVVELRKITGLERSIQVARTALDHFRQNYDRQDRYTAEFDRQFTRPCRACGKPLQGIGYMCECQRPHLPKPPAAAEAPAAAIPTPSLRQSNAPIHRRSKNIQTNFNQAALQGPAVHNPKPVNKATPAPTTAAGTKPASAKHAAKAGTKKENFNQASKDAGAPAAAAATPASAKPAATADAKKGTKKHAKETDPAMARLRATVLRHEPKDIDPEEGNVTAGAAAAAPPCRSRRSRRNAPQADDKLARMLAARQLLDQDQKSQATAAGQAPES